MLYKLMENKISGATGGSLVPLNNSLPAKTQADTNTTETQIIIPEKKIDQINPWRHHYTFSGIRSALYPLDVLKKFIDWQKDKLPTPELLRFREVVTPDPIVQETIDDLFPQFGKSGINLIEVIKSRFIKSEDFEEKIIYLKILFSTSNEDLFINNILVPSLEKRKGFENLECNSEFCKYLLSSLDKESISNIFKQVDYKKITNLNTFAGSITATAFPDVVVNSMLDLNEELTLQKEDSFEATNNIKMVQDALDACIKEVSQVNPLTVSVDRLAMLYKTAVTISGMDKIGDLLTAYYPGEAPKIFKEVFFEKQDESDITRRKRFNAISDYATFIKEGGAKTLGEFIEKETDPLLVGIACYSLVNFCDVDGLRAIIEAIVKQVRKQVPPISLACTIQLMPYGDRYKKILANVLSRAYKTDEGLKRAFYNLENKELGSVKSNNEGKILFHLTSTENDDLIIKLINGIGFKNLIHMASNNKADISREELSRRENGLEILEYAWEKNRNHMMSIFIETVPISNCNDLDMTLRQMVGMSSVKAGSSSDNKAA